MFIIECAVAALIAIALGILVDEDTRDMRIRLTREEDTLGVRP
jgi:sulfopyruvate decarboxylase TPP-binding subunit